VRRTLLAGALVLALAVAAGCGGSSKKSAGATGSTGSDGCNHTAPAAAKKAPPSFTKPENVLSSGAKATLVFDTSCGTIKVELDPARGGPIPNSVAFLAKQGFYDGVTFHRVVPGFVIQGGDPNGNGTGGPGYAVRGPVPKGYHYKVGDVAMAKTQAQAPGTAGSQFFIILSPQGPKLAPEYGVLGHITDKSSMDAVNRIAALGTPGQDGPPVAPVFIDSASVQGG
jgi:peptidyl-prolyl cis-trans isomerase B (cyclophilin B)